MYKPFEYATAGIQFYWRVEVSTVYTYELDKKTGTYSGTGIFEDTVKTDLSFPVEIDLTDV